MDTSKIIEILDALPEDKQAEVLDFVRFLKYQTAKERILAFDKEERISFGKVDDLMTAIDNAG
jgi:hypothetical protein